MASIKSTRGRKIHWTKVVLDVALFPKARDLAMDEFSEMVVGIPRCLLHGTTSPEITVSRRPSLPAPEDQKSALCLLREQSGSQHSELLPLCRILKCPFPIPQ